MMELIHGLSQENIKLKEQVYLFRLQLFDMQRTIYKMYEQLRKYDKTLPPWGGEKPLDPEDDKWTAGNEI